MDYNDFLTEEEIAEIEALLDGSEGVEIEAPLFDDEDAWAMAEQD